MNEFTLRIKWVNINKVFKYYTCYQILFVNINSLHREILYVTLRYIIYFDLCQSDSASIMCAILNLGR